jgi:hypothetical protein
MENHTFRSRLAELMQKSRKALRLYTSMGRINNNAHSELNEMQVQQWKEINADLLKQISVAMESPNSRALVADIFMLRDRFHTAWRAAEADVHLKRRELISSAENGDFIKAAVIGRELVLLKAREQAAQAAHHELQEVLTRSRVAQPTIELSQESVVAEVEVVEEKPTAKIIPLRAAKR